MTSHHSISHEPRIQQDSSLIMCFQSLFEWVALLHPFLTQPIEKPKFTTTAAQPLQKVYDEEFTILQGWPSCRHSFLPHRGTHLCCYTSRCLPCLLAKECGNPNLSIELGPHPIFISSWHHLSMYISVLHLLLSRKHPRLQQSQRPKLLSLQSH